MGSVTAIPVTRRADQLVVGDRILHEFLPSPWFKESGEVVFVKVHNYRKGRYVFVAYMQDNGFYDSTSYQPDGTVGVIPTDPTGLAYSRADDGPDDPTPVSPARVPLHTGGMTDCGLVDETPGLIVGDTADEQRDNAYAAYDRDEGLVDETSAAELGERAGAAIRKTYGEPCQGAPAGFEADCGTPGPHGPHGLLPASES